MAKQTQLRHLLDDLTKKVQRHTALIGDRTATTDQRLSAFNDANGAEKRIFSWFDALNQQIASLQRAFDVNEDACVALRRQIEKMTGTGQPVQKFEPFDLKRAQAGDPIEVRITITGDGADRIDWIPAQFIGVRDNNAAVYECAAQPFVLETPAPYEGLRMASKTRDIQIFANVYEQGGNVWGFVAIEKNDVHPMLPPGRKQLAADLPVTITVAK